MPEPANKGRIHPALRRLAVAGACGVVVAACGDGSSDGEPCASELPPGAALRAGSWDPEFVLPGVNGDAPGVFTITLGPDGDFYAGGIFAFAGSVSARNVARWTAEDGWSALDAGVEGVVTASAVAPDGALWVTTSDWTEDFSSYWHTVRRWDGRWREVAVVTLPPGLSDPQRSGIQRMVFDQAGNLIVAGDFSAIDGLQLSHLAILGPGGWGGLGAAPDGPVFALLTDDSGLCVGGSFGNIGGISASRVACRTQSGWASADLDDFNGGGIVRALARDADGTLYAGGFFSLSDPATNDGGSVARWNGSDWELVDRGVGIWDTLSQANTPGLVRDLAWIGDELVVGGSFLNAGGTTADGRAAVEVEHVARFRPGTSSWEDAGKAPLAVGIAFAGDNVYSLATDGQVLYAGGLFSSVGGESAFNIARRVDGAWAALDHPTDGSLGVEGSVGAVAAGACEIYVGGSFARAGGIEASNVASFTPDTGYAALGAGLEGTITALSVHPHSGELYAAEMVCVESPGLLDCTYSRVMRWDGDSWNIFAAVSEVSLFALGFDADGTLYGAGSGAIGSVVRWTDTGWEPVGGDVDGPALALLIESDGSLIAGGIFETAGGMAARNVARWDGRDWSALGAGVENPVLTLVRHGDRIVAGTQKNPGSSPVSPLVAEWDGTAWANVGAALEGGAFNPQVHRLVSGGDYLVAVGQFPFLGGAAVLEDDAWSVVAGMNQSGRDAVIQPEGLFIAGGFSAVEDRPSVGLGLLRAER